MALISTRSKHIWVSSSGVWCVVCQSCVHLDSCWSTIWVWTIYVLSHDAQHARTSSLQSWEPIFPGGMSEARLCFAALLVELLKNSLSWREKMRLQEFVATCLLTIHNFRPHTCTMPAKHPVKPVWPRNDGRVNFLILIFSIVKNVKN